MRIFPNLKTKEQNTDPELSGIQATTRVIALLIALLSVLFFFIKILFF
jgi:hypothetical protein